MDDQLLALLVQFSIEETRELSAGDLDLQLAVRFQREDLEYYRRERGRPGRQLFRNLRDGIDPMHDSIARFRANVGTSSQKQSQQTHESLPSENDLGTDNELAGPSNMRRDSMGDVEMRQYCTSCGEETSISDGVVLPCGDFFCAACLNRWFKTTCVSESKFPPRCCGQTIPVEGKTEILLDADILTLYNEKKVEFETAAKDRIYCHHCSAFNLRAIEHSILHSVLCDECTTLTCMLCKGKAHSGLCHQI